jgi:uncharacterized membrane protein (UPF0127 family)
MALAPRIRPQALQYQKKIVLMLQNGAMKNLLRISIACVVGMCSPVFAQNAAQHNLPHTALTVGFYQLDTELAQTPEQHAIGLMHRKSMASQEAMLFIFQNPSTQCFWMKNTLIPLTAAFIADDGTIVNLEDMKPQTTSSHCSTKPVRYVLEVNQGWFAKKGMQAGVRLSGQPFTN